MIVATKTDPAVNEWSLDDRILHLREWGTDIVHVLPQLPASGVTEVSIGSASTCSIQLHDPTRRISRLHARVARSDENKWLLSDLASKNGVRVNGAHCSLIGLEPGDEIGIGGLTLIVESRRSAGLRGFLARLLGWQAERCEAVDHALRSVRMATTRRAPLVLCGDGDLMLIARAIHYRTLGVDRPFIVCDPRRRQETKATVRSAANYETGISAFEAAALGSLCMRTCRPPKDFHNVLTRFRDPNSQVHLMLCAQTPERSEGPAVPLTIPPLSTRPDEIDRIITEYADDAIRGLGVLRTGFLPADRDWVRIHSASSMPDIEKATLRLVAIRESRNLSAAAARLGMAPVSLWRWIGRRKLPMHVEP
jgi:FHA domain-containing protein